jgi:hypothetical protein
LLAIGATGVMLALSALMKIDLYAGMLSIPGLREGAPLPPF